MDLHGVEFFFKYTSLSGYTNKKSFRLVGSILIIYIFSFNKWKHCNTSFLLKDFDIKTIIKKMKNTNKYQIFHQIKEITWYFN
jgi:hypothetical protein